jgi:PAS domain-containing protein
MRLVCSYCRKVIRHDAGSRLTDVSHGMCPACAEHFGKLWQGMTLSDYLDTFSEPVLVVDGDARVIGVNQALARLLARDRTSFPGLLGGEAFACVHSRLPEGCGRTVHCRECTIRRGITRVHESGKPLLGVPAYLEADGGRVELSLSVIPEQGLVRVVVEAMRPAAAAEAGGGGARHVPCAPAGDPQCRLAVREHG